MPTRPTWFWTSFFTSIAVNAVLLFCSACWLYNHTYIYQPGYERGAAFVPIYLVPPDPSQDTQLGDSQGTGDAADAASGDEPMEARLSQQAQAFLSRDPEGPGKVGQEPSMSTQIPGENGNGGDGAPAQFGAAADSQEAQATPTFAKKPTEVSQAKEPPAEAQVKSFASALTLSDSANSEQPQPPSQQPSSPQLASITESVPIPPQRASAAQASGGGKPGPAIAAADPAPQTDSESDPFSKKPSVNFKRGSTEVQFGHKHKIIRPRLGLAGETDLLQLRLPVTLILGLTLDDTGNVIHVDVIKSSGSKNVDQACKSAAYQWWLEPSKDKSGKPVKDVVPFTIGFS